MFEAESKAFEMVQVIADSREFSRAAAVGPRRFSLVVSFGGAWVRRAQRLHTRSANSPTAILHLMIRKPTTRA